jgi:hypothetical protein
MRAKLTYLDEMFSLSQLNVASDEDFVTSLGGQTRTSRSTHHRVDERAGRTAVGPADGSGRRVVPEPQRTLSRKVRISVHHLRSVDDETGRSGCIRTAPQKFFRSGDSRSSLTDSRNRTLATRRPVEKSLSLHMLGRPNPKGSIIFDGS